MMIEHHESAIEMAKTEQEDGQYSPVISLAEETEAAQATEIDTMHDAGTPVLSISRTSAG